MSKEMFIASSPHETKVAVLEDDQLVEVYFEREADVGLVGGIYKGRVSRVLPGMRGAGHMGNERVTVQSLEVVRVDQDKNVVLVRGAVPGADNGLLMVRTSVKRRQAKR